MPATVISNYQQDQSASFPQLRQLHQKINKIDKQKENDLYDFYRAQGPIFSTEQEFVAWIQAARNSSSNSFLQFKQEMDEFLWNLPQNR